MRIGKFGLQVIKDFEGCELTSYLCPAGIWTIGFGHTGPDVEPNMTIAQWRADELLARDLEKFERAISVMVKVKVSQRQFDALVSFAYNVGLDAFRNSTLLSLLNQGDYRGAAKQFGRWNRINGMESIGLTRRRQAEEYLFLKDMDK